MNKEYVDCQDMSATVHLFTRAIGGSHTYVRKDSDGFNYKPVRPVGIDDWSGGAWDLHQVGYYYGVYDACVKINPYNPRIPRGESISEGGSYYNDIYDSGSWSFGNDLTYSNVR